jgi:ribonuclease E
LPLAADADEAGEPGPGFAPGEGELTVVEATAAVVSSPASIPEPITEIGGPDEEPPFAGEPEVPGEPAEAIEDAEPAEAETADVESRVNGVEEAHEEAEPKPPSPYETVNQPPQQPRRGWWKRIIE